MHASSAASIRGKRIPAIRFDRELARLVEVMNGMLERSSASTAAFPWGSKAHGRKSPAEGYANPAGATFPDPAP